MIETAGLSLWFGIGACVASVLVRWWGRRPWALALLGAAAAAFWFGVAVLARALVRSDFSVTYVVDHSRDTSSAPYRLAGLWGGMAGSLLLWTALLATIVAWALVRRPLGRVAHGVGAALVVGTASTVAVAANPFDRLAIPAISGRGLTPILEHPAMLIHPPVLYTGLLLTVVPMLAAVEAAVAADASAPLREMRAAVHAAALWIGVGLVLGASWAYAELGWGGYWAWDPVENAALMPWLVLLAWLHAARAPWATPRFLAGLAAVPLLLVFFGAWITRGGLTESVHAFAQTPGVGRGFVVLVLGIGLVTAVTFRRVPGALFAEGVGATSGPVVLAGLLLFAVILGTGYPVAREVFTDERVSVTGSYFSRAAWPLGVAATVLLALVVVRRPRAAAAVGLAAGGGVGLALGLPWYGAVLSASAGSAALVAVGGVATDGARRWIHLAHLGFAIMLIGVAGTTGTEQARIGLTPGEVAEFRGEAVELRSIDVVELRGDRTAVQAELRVDGVTLRPARVAHTRVGAVLPETDTDNRWTGDLQTVLREATDGFVVVELRYRPLAGFIWWGAAVMLTGLAGARRRPACAGGAGRSSTAAAPASAVSPARGASAPSASGPEASGSD